MNARQKAKKYKRLYEEVLGKTIQPKIIYENLKHYKYACMVQRDEPMGIPDEVVKSHTIRKLTDGLREVVEKNMEVEEDIYSGRYICRIDVWARR